MKKKPSTLSIHEVSYLLGVQKKEALAILCHSGLPVVIQRGAIRIPSDDFYAWYQYLCSGGAA